MRFLLGLAALLLIASPSASLGQLLMPTPEHEWLKESVGEWDFKMSAGGAEFAGVVTRKLGIGGLWVVNDLDLDFGGAKFAGHGLDTYDPVKKKFVGYWFDSNSATPIASEGELSADKKTLTLRGKGPNESGDLVDYKMVTEYKDKDNHIFKMWRGDLEGDPVMVATYVRKKK